jgi:mannose-6-phosphate isomerase-like protein (cupin superfamily)
MVLDAAKLARVEGRWAPHSVATFNGHDVVVVKVLGGFVWHAHPDADDLFLVLSGRLTIRLRDGEITLGPGELGVVPRGVEHQPFAAEETHLLLIEPTGTPNTGDPATAAPRRALGHATTAAGVSVPTAQAGAGVLVRRAVRAAGGVGAVR